MRTYQMHCRQNKAVIAADTPLAELNITPLIDVLLVLLVMLMLSVPAVTHKVPVNLPSEAAGSGAPVVNRLFLNAAGTAIWNEIPMNSDRLRARLERMVRDPTKPQLRFESDPLARYGRVDHLVAMIKRAGITEIGFVGNQKFAQWDVHD